MKITSTCIYEKYCKVCSTQFIRDTCVLNKRTTINRDVNPHDLENEFFLRTRIPDSEGE